MPSHLHPRSTATSALFAGTLVASFVVVAVPHIWPCPRPRQAYMDSEIIIDDQGRAMRRVRKVKKPGQDVEGDSAEPETITPSKAISRVTPNQRGNSLQDEAAILRQLQAEYAAKQQEQERRPCPVPKPGGAIGRFLGFEDKQQEPSQR